MQGVVLPEPACYQLILGFLLLLPYDADLVVLIPRFVFLAQVTLQVLSVKIVTTGAKGIILPAFLPSVICKMGHFTLSYPYSYLFQLSTTQMALLLLLSPCRSIPPSILLSPPYN